MARSRSRRKNESNEDSGNTEDTNTNERQGARQMAGISAEMIEQLLAQRRTKGLYVQYLNRFVESGEAGIEVGVEYPDLRGKQASTLVQGFRGAQEKKEAAEGSENVQVISQKDDEGNEHVFLINISLVAGAAEDAA